MRRLTIFLALACAFTFASVDATAQELSRTRALITVELNRRHGGRRKPDGYTRTQFIYGDVTWLLRDARRSLTQARPADYQARSGSNCASPVSSKEKKKVTDS